ncbi:hypothetical protein J2S78_001326 [Salibacterium salarium]|nr:hypothetical protein [Salibacterium salarium]
MILNRRKSPPFGDCVCFKTNSFSERYGDELMPVKEVSSMKTNSMESDLYCNQCREEVPHVIRYINHELSSIMCQKCGRELEVDVDIMNELYGEVYSRITTKPSRITKEYRHNHSDFFFSLPTRVISKPYRLMKDMHETQKVIRRYKK